MQLWTLVMVVVILIFVVLPTLRPQTFPVKKLILMPAVFMYLLYDSLSSNFQLNQHSIFVIIVGVILGCLTGFLIRHPVKIEVNHEYQLMTMSGSYASLLFFILIFAAHFAVGYFKSVNPSVFLTPNLTEQLLLFALVFTSFMTIGASGCLFYKYLNSR